MGRKLFCEINSFTYYISVKKERLKRHIKNFLSNNKFVKTKGNELPILVYKHNSLIRRQLGNVDMHLQENKAVNLSLSAPKISGITIKPGETFSFWTLVGNCTKAKGYKTGLTISLGNPSSAIGGGMCQLTNLIHWMVLHSPLDIIEHHHHDNIDIFPDFGRKVPFGCGTSILYNYFDYQFKNNTDTVFQLIVYTTDTHLCGELRASKVLNYSYHIIEVDAYFVMIENCFYRRNKIYRSIVDKHTGNEVSRMLIKESNAKVLYDKQFINENLLRIELA
jgi:vancomycin resistance protein VanW